MSEQDVLRELQSISKILVLTNSQIVERELAKVASSDDRKRMWILLDGKHTTKDIASEVKVTPRAVRYFLADAERIGLVDFVNDFPRRRLDYVPPSWLGLISTEPTVAEDTSTRPQDTLDLTSVEETKN